MGSGWGDQFPPLAMVNPTGAWARKDLVWGWAPSPREDDESPWSCQDWIQRAAPPTHPGSLLCPQLIFLLPDSMMGSGPIQRADPPALKTGQTSPGVQKGLSQGCLQHPPPPPRPHSFSPTTPAPQAAFGGWAGQGQWMAHHPAPGGDTAWSQGHQKAMGDDSPDSSREPSGRGGGGAGAAPQHPPCKLKLRAGL